MKPKHALITACITVPAAAVIRTLQYIYIIDSSGHYDMSAPFASVLNYSLYAVYGIALLALILLFATGGNSICTFEKTLSDKGSRLVFALLMLAFAYEAGVRVGASMNSGELDWFALLAAFSALFFFGVSVLPKSKPLSEISGLFPPIYLIAIGVSQYFSALEEAGVSDSKLKALSICALLLYITALCVMNAGVTVSRKRFAAVALLACTAATPASVSRLIAIALGKVAPETPSSEYAWIAIQILIAASAVVSLIRLTCLPEEYLPEPEPESEAEEPQTANGNGLDIYIDEIEEEEEQNNENA